MTREEAIEAMQEAARVSRGDPEAGHGAADDILCARLIALGETELVDLFNNVDMWYA